MLAHIAAYESNGEIAAALCVSEATVQTRINHIFTKTALRDRAQLVAYAYRRGCPAIPDASLGRPSSGRFLPRQAPT